MENLINSKNVGKIAERIVANELEFHGFRVTDLNKEGLSANADLLAVGHDKVLQIQVKGATNKPNERSWIQYGHSTPEIISREKPIFNKHDKSFYKADVVALVAVVSPSEYKCIVMPCLMAEKAAQLNIDGYYRLQKKSGDARKPGKIWMTIEGTSKETSKSPTRVQERKILQKYLNAWHLLY